MNSQIVNLNKIYESVKPTRTEQPNPKQHGFMYGLSIFGIFAFGWAARKMFNGN